MLVGRIEEVSFPDPSRQTRVMVTIRHRGPDQRLYETKVKVSDVKFHQLESTAYCDGDVFTYLLGQPELAAVVKDDVLHICPPSLARQFAHAKAPSHAEYTSAHGTDGTTDNGDR